MELKRPLASPDKVVSKRRKHEEDQQVSQSIPFSRLRSFLRVSLPSSVSQASAVPSVVQKWSRSAITLLGDAVTLLTEQLLGDVIEQTTWLSRGDPRLVVQSSIRLNAHHALDYIEKNSKVHPWVLAASHLNDWFKMDFKGAPRISTSSDDDGEDEPPAMKQLNLTDFLSKNQS